MARIRKGDTVAVIAGKHKGARGKVLRVLNEQNRVVIERVAMVKRHTKPTQQDSKGGIIEKEAPVFVDNLMLVCPKCSAPTRARSERLADGRRVRACRRCGAHVDK